MPVSLAMVGPVFGRVTFDWLHDVWHERGLLSGDLGQSILGMMGPAEVSVLRAVWAKDASPPAQAAVPSSADGSDFLSTAAAHVAVDKPIESPAVVNVKVFSPCPAVGGASASSCSTHSDRGFADIGSHNKDMVCPLCELCDDNLQDGLDGTPVRTCEVVICEGCEGGFHVACVQALLPLCCCALVVNHPVHNSVEPQQVRGSRACYRSRYGGTVGPLNCRLPYL